MSNLSLHYSGYCMANGWAVERGRPFKEIPFLALWALFESKTHGYILLDTGYSLRNKTYTQRFPNKIYDVLTRVSISKENEAVEILKRKGIEAHEVKHIIISHFHGDHVGGLKDFPNAHIWCKRAALDHILNFSNYWAFSKGYLKELLPNDIQSRVSFIDELPRCTIQGLNHCWQFIEPSIVLVDLPGHARGQVGVLHTPSAKFLVVDAAWTIQNITHLKYPRQLVTLLVDSYAQLKSTLNMLATFSIENPNIELIPTHCPTLVNTYFNGEITP